jgi:4a-hydroxytetrahydrobiopterin dehydratase
MNEETSLAQKKCLPCSEGTSRLRGKEIESLLPHLHSGWRVIEEHRLEKEYNFPNFKRALQFTNDVGHVAEEEGHHPDIYLAWGKVRITLWTHKINGLSESDFILAAKCDEQFTHHDTNKSF